MFKGYRIYRFHMIGISVLLLHVVVHASVCLLHFLFVFHCCFAISFRLLVSSYLPKVFFSLLCVLIYCVSLFFSLLCVLIYCVSCFFSLLCVLICVSILLYTALLCVWFVFRTHSIAYFRCFIQYVLLRFISHGVSFLLARSLFVCVYFDCLHIHYCVSYSFYWCLPAT